MGMVVVRDECRREDLENGRGLDDGREVRRKVRLWGEEERFDENVGGNERDTANDGKEGMNMDADGTTRGAKRLVSMEGWVI